MCIVYDVSMLVRTQILFPKEDLMELRLMAAEKGWSVSETVRRIVKEKTTKAGRKRKTIEVLKEMAKNAYRGNVPRDLSTNDEYLYGKLAPDYPLRRK